MTSYEIVDLTVDGNIAERPTRTTERAGRPLQNAIGTVEGRALAQQIEDLRAEISHVVQTGDSGLKLTTLVLKLTLTAEGRVAFIAKGAVEGSIEVTLARTGS